LTSEIWFGYIDSGFFGVLARGRVQMVGGEFRHYFALPMRTVTGDGSGRFHIVYGGMDTNSRVINLSNEIIARALSGNYVQTTQPPVVGELLVGDIIIYEYAFDMPVDIFMDALDLRGVALSGQIERFSRIIFSPHSDRSGVNVFFHNQVADAWVGFFVDDMRLSNELGLVVRTESRSPYALVDFASSYLLGIDNNSGNNLFIPVWGDAGHRYFVGVATPAHFDITDGAVMNVIRANVMSFFDNPAVVYDVPTAGGFAWADENTIVRHFRTNVIQYISYRRDLRGSELLDDFASAISFVNRRDMFLDTEFYLSGFREHGNERVFYFEYTLEGLPVILSDDLRNLMSDHTQSALSIRFRDGNLVSYTRLAYTFTMSDAIVDVAGRDLPMYILYSGLDLDSLKGVTLAFVSPRLDSLGAGDMSLWVNFRMQDGMSAMESLR